jgi:hypothetical protein
MSRRNSPFEETALEAHLDRLEVQGYELGLYT